MKNHSSKQTSEFYDDLMKGEKKFTFFPKIKDTILIKFYQKIT